MHGRVCMNTCVCANVRSLEFYREAVRANGINIEDYAYSEDRDRLKMSSNVRVHVCVCVLMRVCLSMLYTRMYVLGWWLHMSLRQCFFYN